MTIKKLAAFVGAGATVVTAGLGWASMTTERVSINKSEIQNIKTDVSELKTSIHEVYRQNVEIDNKLTEILHKQDKRLELVEYQLAVKYDK